LSAGRTKSDAPAMTTPHFMTGALQIGKAVLATARQLQSTDWGPNAAAEASFVARGDIPEMNSLDPNLTRP
jgi:hypothetical protein